MTNASMKIGNATLRVVRGSLIEQKVDVIVNAANKELRQGEGICGVIYRAAGEQEMNNYILTHYPSGLPDGVFPVITPSFSLPQKAVIHTAGPIYQESEFPRFELKRAYVFSLALARDYKFQSIGFCSISTGIYGYPLQEAAHISVQCIVGFLDEGQHNFKNVTLAMFGEEEYNVFLKELRTTKYYRKANQ